MSVTYDLTIPASIGEFALKHDQTTVCLLVHSNANRWFARPCSGPAGWVVWHGQDFRWGPMLSAWSRFPPTYFHLDGRPWWAMIGCDTCGGTSSYLWSSWPPNRRGLRHPHRAISMERVPIVYPHITIA